MVILVTGGSASGKSEYAEKLAAGTKAGERVYVATMRPWGEEGRQRVEKHRAMRRDRRFITVERYEDLAGLCMEPAPAGRVVLLECLSNLVANEQFDVGGSDREIADRILDGIRHLQNQAEAIIIVTNEVFSDGVSYPFQTRRYLRILGEVNSRAAGMADRVVEVVYGIPVLVKPRQAAQKEKR